MKFLDVDYEKLSNGIKQYHCIKLDHLDKIVFFQLGDFYEMFFEDALFMNREVDLTLTGKNAGLDKKIPMAGIPLSVLNEYVKKVIDLGKKVVVVQQTDKIIDKIVERKVVKIITPGNFLNIDETDNKFIGVINEEEEKVYISVGDLNTGDMYNFIFDDLQLAIDKMINIGVVELININHTIKDNNYFSVIELKKESNIKKLEYTNNVLLDYFKELTVNKIDHLKEFELVSLEETMGLNMISQQQLELITTIKGDYSGSLYNYLNHTNTAMGRRLLKTQIINPLYNIKKIEDRLDIVQSLMEDVIISERLTNHLKLIYDLERINAKISELSLMPKDVVQLKQSIIQIPYIRDILLKSDDKKLVKLVNEIPNVEDVFQLIDERFYEEPANSIKDGSIFKVGFDKELDELRSIKENSNQWLAKFELKEKEKTQAKSLKVKYNRIFGYFIEIPNGQLHKISDNYIRKQTMANCERFITEELKEAENKILNASEKINRIELEYFLEFRELMKEKIVGLQKVATAIGKIDFINSLSKVSYENGLVRPNFNTENIIEVKDGFHPVISKLVETYVKNGIYLDNEKNILLITGPNMAGKSTYMRQLAILIIMAQIGCYTPCSSCNLALIDRIFTRVGSSDDSSEGKSTFMVEMIESAQALRQASENSLILFDELGRGTSTYDGMAIAASILKYINDKIRAKTLFSTHYHELINLEEKLKGIKNVHVKANEENGNITFYHKVVDGGIENSYGIAVAKLAKLPLDVIVNANLYLDELSNEEKIIVSNNNEEKIEIMKESQTIETIKNIDVDNLTPKDALNLIYELKDLNQ